MDLVQTLSGFVVGLIVGLTGVGGGSLMTPLLVLGFGVAPATAVGTDLLYAAITKCGGVWVNARRQSIDWRVVRFLALGSLPASAAMIWALHHFAIERAQFDTLITTTLGVALILTALAILFRRRLRELGARWGMDATPNEGALGHPGLVVAAGLVLGVLVTISSVGAGALGVAVLFFLFPHFNTLRIVGTDIAHAVPLTLVAGLGHATLGSIDWSLLLALLAGSLPGIYLGSHLAAKVPEVWLRSALATMLLLIGGKFVL
ncbi:MAG: sulfite exporter TauE/SafE family protein [Burkholderiales bacterium]|nr:MAG: sulfite exporter TauE/SafE family protein [Burkholderiales bacterium]